MEIYNEEIIDLLGAEMADNPRLRIYEDRKVIMFYLSARSV